MLTLRLTCTDFWVDVRLREINGRWLASAETPDGPSLGLGLEARHAIEQALEPFDGIVDELLASLPSPGLARRDRFAEPPPLARRPETLSGLTAGAILPI